VRRGEAKDLETIAAIQAASPEAAQWDPSDYLGYDLSVAVVEERVAGFLASRTLVPGESEILNVAVLPEYRRRGVGRTLLATWLGSVQGTVFLEVRASNEAARTFYRSLGFEDFLLRPQYYALPPETGIVMKFHSC